MKIRITETGKSAGSALVFTVLLMGLVAVLVSTYMTLVQNQNRATMRSQAWNATVPLIEAGIEEALAHLNHNGRTNLLVDGWQLINGRYYKMRTVGNGFYIVGISNTGLQAIIQSQGYVDLPGFASASPSTMLATVSLTSLSSTHLGRGVEVLAKADSLFAKGLVAKGQIDLKGNNITSDSFDSSDPAYNTGGSYDSSKSKDNGDVATNSGLVNSLNVGNAEIRGKVSTGPGGSIAIGATGTVGSDAWHDAGNTGIEPGASTDDMNVSFPDVVSPYTAGFAPAGGTYDGDSYDYVLGNGVYYMSDLSMSANQGMIVTNHAFLYIEGDASLSGSASITIAPGASLRLYVAGESASLDGNGVINKAGNATNFFYYGLPSNKEVSITGNGEFIGVVYAPSADLLLSGGGAGETDVVGASISASVTMNGHFNFHYDEGLRKYGPPRTFVVTSWEEMHPNRLAYLEQLVMQGAIYNY